MMAKKMEAMNSELRSAFREGVTRPIEWRLSQLEAVISLLNERRGEIEEALLIDLGKSSFESFCTEIALVLNACDLMKKNLKKWMKPVKVSMPLVLQPSHGAIVAEPLGVVLIISTWNYPIALALNPLLGAIAAGNAAVLKCSENAPSVSALIAKLVPLYLDSRAIRVVEGGIPESEELLKQKWEKIFFTGSVHVGKIVLAAAVKHLTPVTLELGGKSPTIFDSGIDLKTAARRFVGGKWGINAGQTCVAPDYVLVKEENAQTLVEEFVAILKEFFGNDREKCPDLMRIVNRQHFSRLTSFLTDQRLAKSIVHGGKYNDEKLFIEPTILLDPPLDSTIMNEEIFGPILPIITIQSMSDAIDFVNSRGKPLSLYLFTDDEELKKRVVNETSAGSVVINDAVIHVGVDSLPFGGVGESGMGAYHGKYSFDTFSHMKPVVYRTLWGDAMVRYPPYNTSKAQNIVRHITRFDYIGLLLVLLGFKR